MTVKLARNYITSRLFGSNWEITGKFFQEQRGSISHCADQFHAVGAEGLGDREVDSVDLLP